MPSKSSVSQCRFELLNVGLEHGRAKFIYHAGQRQTSIRFYFVALAIVATAFVGVLTADPLSILFAKAKLLGLVLGGSGIIVSLLFWALDCRNTQLVDCDEKLVKGIEKELADL